MLTTTEVILNLCIWTLLGVGLFFGLRATLRRRQKRRGETTQR